MNFTVGMRRNSEPASHAPGSPRQRAAKAAGEAFTVIAPVFTAAGSSEQMSTRAASSLSPAPSA